MHDEAAEILDFWFGPATEDPDEARARQAFWFDASPQADAAVRARYLDTIEAARRGELDRWAEDARSSLALVVVLDQFPRNAYRGSARAFAYGERALAVARTAVARGCIEKLSPLEAAFLILPFQHDESLESQRAAVRFSREILERAPDRWQSLMRVFHDFAEQHLAIIERFGRFPHRNHVLGRASTEAELGYLAGGGATFGQG